jgi:peptidoglycan hydrolase-like protein with peptidoglycan-binding domain
MSRTIYIVQSGKGNSYGDTNGDGKVDIADVTAIINKINNAPPASFDATAADVNGDGKIDIADVTGVINIINQ